ncbi:hypothetical protein P692DRAFT_20841744 [Suillus brevipes Sb2]|nr:hypothetical protein P692DRAFT_20841744 [Suillus brevipes Sb2]
MATIDAQHLRERIGRFRILIIGRANSGKTTILQKICNTTEDPEIYNTKGEKLDDTVVESSIKRGNHDIKNEMVFKSNPGFVFHDSCGFEAGSEHEFEDMKNFISERVHATKLEERIHAIWYCIPMDNPSRTFQRSEEKFFIECDTRHVPVVAVFTKFEALRPVAFAEIKSQLKGLSTEERSRRIAQRVEEVFMVTGVLDRLSDPKNRTRAKSHVRLQNMNQPNANCDTLLESTTFALNDEELRLCLVSTQQSNLELCIKYAVATLVHPANRQFGSLRVEYEVYQYNIARWFPHVKDNIWKDSIIRALQPLAAKGSLFSAANRLIQIGIATIIVLEYSACLLNNLDALEGIDSAVDHYLNSPTAVAVEKGAKEISRRRCTKEELEKKIFEFILENRMRMSFASF